MGLILGGKDKGEKGNLGIRNLECGIRNWGFYLISKTEPFSTVSIPKILVYLMLYI